MGRSKKSQFKEFIASVSKEMTDVFAVRMRWNKRRKSSNGVRYWYFGVLD